MVTGFVPYQGTTPAATMLKHLTERPVSPSKVRPDRNIPAALESIIDRAMALRPEDRFESMSALERELVMLGDNLRSRPSSTAALKLPNLPDLAKLAKRSIKPTRTGFYALGAGLLVSLLVIGGLVIKLRRTTQQVRRANADVVTPASKPGPTTVVWVVDSNPKGAQIVRTADGTVLGTTP
jgi:serine/threonine protein kinase